MVDLDDSDGHALHIDIPGNEFRIRPHLTEQVCLGRREVCYPLKHAYDKANLTLEGQRSAMGENCWIETDAIGVPTVTHKFQKEDISVPEKSDKAVEIERVIASDRLKRLLADESDVSPELDQESDGEEALGGGP